MEGWVREFGPVFYYLMGPFHVRAHRSLVLPAACESDLLVTTSTVKSSFICSCITI